MNDEERVKNNNFLVIPPHIQRKEDKTNAGKKIRGASNLT